MPCVVVYSFLLCAIITLIARFWHRPSSKGTTASGKASMIRGIHPELYYIVLHYTIRLVEMSHKNLSSFSPKRLSCVQRISLGEPSINPSQPVPPRPLYLASPLLSTATMTGSEFLRSILPFPKCSACIRCGTS